MSVLLQHLWPALALAGVLGLGVVLVFGRGNGLPSARLDVTAGAILLLLVALILAVLQAVPGRAGLWLDIAVACVLFYASGVGIGSAISWWRERGEAAEPAVEDVVGASRD